jgi:hypothetical protein
MPARIGFIRTYWDDSQGTRVMADAIVYRSNMTEEETAEYRSIEPGDPRQYFLCRRLLQSHVVEEHDELDDEEEALYLLSLAQATDWIIYDPAMSPGGLVLEIRK